VAAEEEPMLVVVQMDPDPWDEAAYSQYSTLCEEVGLLSNDS
jgi:hypothetical protein